MADRAEASYKNKEDRMKKVLSLSVIVLFLAGVIVSGCSKQDESKETASERLGKDIANQIKSPVEKTEDVTSKIQGIRATESELTE